MSLPAQLHSSLQSTGAGQYICNTTGEGRVSSSLLGLAPRCSVAQNPHTLKTKLHGLSCAPTLECQQAYTCTNNSLCTQPEWVSDCKQMCTYAQIWLKVVCVRVGSLSFSCRITLTPFYLHLCLHFLFPSSLFSYIFIHSKHLNSSHLSWCVI